MYRRRYYFRINSASTTTKHGSSCPRERRRESCGRSSDEVAKNGVPYEEGDAGR